ncbi:MAG: transposase [Bacteriovoracaceae bacterium]|jgi:putative transposase|nr:hypothetical protein [Halobacteriovoraceae bacterium]MDP7321667.1 transposase [Bacteriovoracaceae bacterium]|tara:strand:- start:390 stop:1019 length:630 start_codon:yes stop_codon:yes gene_type:complete
MPRKKLIRTHLFPYHVTTRTINQDWFDISLYEVWRIALYSLKLAHKVYPIELISFVLMSNHYHLLLKTPNSNLDLFMYEFNKKFAQILLKRSKRTNRVFGNRYKWCLIQNQTYLYNCYRYIYQNPIRAKIVQSAENYPFSTLHYLVNNKEFPVPIIDYFGFKDEYALSWLNQNLETSEEQAIKNAFRYSILNSLKIRKTRSPLIKSTPY